MSYIAEHDHLGPPVTAGDHPGQIRSLLPGTSRSQLRGLAVRDGAHRMTLEL